MLRGKTPAHRTADLDGFETFVFLDPTAHIIDQLAQGDPQWYLNQPGVFHVASQGKGFGAFALCRAHAGEPFRPTQDDLRNVSVSFNVIVIGGFAP